MKEKGIKAYIIPTSDPHQSEYLADHYKTRVWISGFTGSAGTVVVTENEAILWTDGRYFIQAENQLAGSEIQLFKMGIPGFPTYMEWLRDNLEEGDTIGFNGKEVCLDPKKNQRKLLIEEIVQLVDYKFVVGNIDNVSDTYINTSDKLSSILAYIEKTTFEFDKRKSTTNTM